MLHRFSNNLLFLVHFFSIVNMFLELSVVCVTILKHFDAFEVTHTIDEGFVGRFRIDLDFAGEWQFVKRVFVGKGEGGLSRQLTLESHEEVHNFAFKDERQRFGVGNYALNNTFIEVQTHFGDDCRQRIS